MYYKHNKKSLIMYDVNIQQTGWKCTDCGRMNGPHVDTCPCFLEHSINPSYPTYPVYPTYPTYPVYPTIPTYPNPNDFGPFYVDESIAVCNVNSDVDSAAITFITSSK